MSIKFTFSTSGELVCLPAEAVVFITADGNYSSITTADGRSFMLTLQLGQIEKQIQDSVRGEVTACFIRIGKSLIVNRNFITHIQLARQRLELSDCRTFRHEVAASKEALKALKALIEKEATT